MARQRILEAAANLAEEEGVLSLSMDRVAEKAGVSKGGLLYHFNTKEAMMTALMRCTIDQHEEAITDRVAQGERYSDAAIRNCIDKSNTHGNLVPAFVAAVATDRAAQELIRDRKEAWREGFVRDGVSRQASLILSLALDGLFIGQSLSITELDPSDRELVLEGLLNLTQPTPKECLANLFREALAHLEAEG